MRLRKIWFPAQRQSKMRHRLFLLALTAQDSTQVVDRIRVGWAKRKCGLKRAYSVIQSAQTSKYFPNAIVEFRDIRGNLNRPANVFHCCGMLAELKREHAKQVQRIRMIGLLLQYFPVQRFGFLKMARLVKANRISECLRNRRHQGLMG